MVCDMDDVLRMYPACKSFVGLSLTSANPPESLPRPPLTHFVALARSVGFTRCSFPLHKLCADPEIEREELPIDRVHKWTRERERASDWFSSWFQRKREREREGGTD